MWKPDTPQGFEPSYSTFTPIEHYYGDSVRELILGGTVLMLLTSPLYADKIVTEFPFEVVGAIAAVCFAALTNPWKRWVLIGDAVLSGVAAVIFQAWAVLDFSTDNPVAFVLREAIAVIALFALYFSIKTVRAMVLNQVGRQPVVPEFSNRELVQNSNEAHKMPTVDPREVDPLAAEESVEEDDLGES